jgi:hypothetical protein
VLFKTLSLGAAAALLIWGAPRAQEPPLGGGELLAGAFAHGVRTDEDPGPNAFVEGTEEGGTADVQVGLRSRPVGPAWLLRPRLAVKAQINTDGRTNFFSVGAEWRRDVAGGRAYLQAGAGLTYQDGYEFTPDPFAPGLSPAERERRYDVYLNRTSFGSKVLFNPNLSVGVRLSPGWALEGVWEHYSHKQVFDEQNPGIDNFGLRLVRAIRG